MSVDHLNWRYAVKKFDPSKKISKAHLEEILEVLRLAPSSFGLQPWKFIVIEDLGLREQIRPFAWNQGQVTECSHLIVLCSLASMDEAYVKTYINHVAEVRSIPLTSLSRYEQMMTGFIKKLNPEARVEWMKNQIYLALGMLLSECAHLKIDTCPMEGFEPEKVDALLNLRAQNLKSVVLCPIGYRAADDKDAQLKKVRFNRSDIVILK